MSGRADLVVIGGGEHARVVIEVALSRPDAFRVAGFLDLEPCPETERRCGVPQLGSDEQAVEIAARGGVQFVLGVGTVGVSSTRADIVERLEAAGVRWATVVHAHGWVSPTATVAEGTVLMAGVLVNTGARIGRHVVVNTGAVIEHDVRLEDFAQLGPAVVLGGGVRVGRGSYLGLGCRVRDHIAIGQGVTVGMGSVVVRPVPDGAVVMGVPARPRREAARP